MSNTFAVETKSGGSRRMSWIRPPPLFRSFFSWARRTRMSFARFSASMRWSSDQTGAWAWVLVGTLARDTTIEPARTKGQNSFFFQGFLGDNSRLRVEPLRLAMRSCAGLCRVREAMGRGLGRELRTDPLRRARVAEENRPQSDVRGARGDQLERVAAGRHAAHPDDREPGRAIRVEDGGERDRLQRRPRVAARPGAQARRERALVEREPADRVHEREPVRARLLRGPRDRAHVRD